MTETEIDDFLARAEARARAGGLAALTPRERAAHLAAVADFEIALGGLAGFYENAAGDRAPETVAALEAIGAARAADALRDANRLFSAAVVVAAVAVGGGDGAEGGDDGAVPDRAARQARLPLIPDALRALEDAWSRQQPGVWDLLVAYVRA